ncbi:MAG: hypothetical protein PHV75_07665 [Victivallaceae bacterium]|nr:hypothetical protein [Victivallaceae bacterium]MDD5599713.1 hypothetical protein [Victivallaceae bacterium]
MIIPANVQTYLISAVYHAPRGRSRLYNLGCMLSQRYLHPSDLLIGVIGSEGSGKSTLIRGLFPGLELTNDDDGVNLHPAPILNFSENDFFSGHTFHLDIRHESAFTQMFKLVEAVNMAIRHERRVVVEHFDLLYKHLGYNAQVIFAIGEDVRVYRPSVFSQSPLNIKKEVDQTIKYRLMAHSAEDITSHIMERDYGYEHPNLHSDVKHGFVIGFKEKPNVNLKELEEKVMEVIDRNLPISPAEGNHITFGESKMYCTGKRIHVKFTGEIENFRLLNEFRYDPINREYLLVGIVGKEFELSLETLPPVQSP